MSRMLSRVTILTLAVALLLHHGGQAFATDGDPLALRKWSNGMLSIETHWGFHIVINPNREGGNLRQLPRPADLALLSPSEIPGVVDSNTVVVDAAGRMEASEAVHHYLSRTPNSPRVRWTPVGEDSPQDPSAVRVREFRRDGASAFELDVDGVRILYLSDGWSASSGEVPDMLDVRSIDLLVVASPDAAGSARPQVASVLESIGPKAVLFNRIEDVRELNPFMSANGIGPKPIQVSHNTLALAHSTTTTVDDEEPGPRRLIVMSDRPWQMPARLADLFSAMEQASRDSQKVFAGLSINQMNFRPSNGTHTPRWNAEHMMGRHLLFFSQIYHEQDPTIPVMDLNPKQMPSDYVAAHPDWSGPEEARQMQRVSEFSRRFAYRLADLDLDEMAPGSIWTVRGLLQQMKRHYDEHTANTVKKFELPDWPTDE